MSPDEIDNISVSELRRKIGLDLASSKDYTTVGILSQLKSNNLEQRLADLQHQHNKAILESNLMTPAEWAERMIERPKTLSGYPRTFIPFWDIDVNIEHPDPSKLNIRVKRKKRKAFNFNN